MKEIRYYLKDIDESQFAVLPDNFKEGVELTVEAMIHVAATTEGTDLKCDSRLELKQGENLILITEITCKYGLTKDSWEDVDETKKKLPLGFIRHIASLSIGTQRGIILGRTKDTSLHKVLLPPISLEGVIKEDYILDTSKAK